MSSPGLLPWWSHGTGRRAADSCEHAAQGRSRLARHCHHSFVSSVTAPGSAVCQGGNRITHAHSRHSNGTPCDSSAIMARLFCSGCCCKVCCRYRHCCCSLQGSVPSKQTLYTLTLPVRTAQVLVTTMRPHAKPQTHPAPQRVQLLQQHMRQKHSFRQVQVLTAAIQTFRRCCSITHTSIL